MHFSYGTVVILVFTKLTQPCSMNSGGYLPWYYQQTWTPWVNISKWFVQINTEKNVYDYIIISYFKYYQTSFFRDLAWISLLQLQIWLSSLIGSMANFKTEIAMLNSPTSVRGSKSIRYLFIIESMYYVFSTYWACDLIINLSSW